MQRHYVVFPILKASMIRLLCAVIVYAFLPLPGGLLAQNTSVWEVIDAKEIKYTGSWEYFSPLAAADADHFVAIGTAIEGRFGRLVRRTSDGGQHWTNIMYDTLRGDPGPGFWTERWTAVAHPTPEVVVVTGYHARDLPNAFNDIDRVHTGLYHTTKDGGETWNKVELDSNSRASAVSMCDAMNGLIVVQTIGNRDNPEPNAQADYILRTNDGWQTSFAHSLPTSVTFCKTVVCIEPDLYVLMAYNADRGEDRVYRSSDGGESWQESAALPEGMGAGNLCFLNPLEGWSVGGVSTGIGFTKSDLITRTLDGGLTWKVQYDEVLAPAFGLISVDFADEKNGLAVGFAGPKILRTRDGGESWVAEYAPYNINASQTLASLAFPRHDAAIAMFPEAIVLGYSGAETLLPPALIRPGGNDVQPVDKVTVEWTPIEGATHYQIHIALEKTVQKLQTIYNAIIIDSVLTGTSLELNDLQFDQCYYARVRSINAQDTSDWRERRKGCLFTTIESDATIAAPNILQPESGATAVAIPLTIVWESVADAVSYDIQIAEIEKSFLIPEHIVVSESGLTETSLSVSDLRPDTEHFVRVRVHTADASSAWSSQSAPHPFRTQKITSVADLSAEANQALLQIVPQPAADWAHVFVSGLALNTTMHITLYDLLGLEVMRLERRARPAIPVELNLSIVPAGVYFLRVKGAGFSLTGSLQVVK